MLIYKKNMYHYTAYTCMCVCLYYIVFKSMLVTTGKQL